MDVDTVIMSLGTSPNPLISSTTKGLEVNKRRCIIAEEETGKTSKDGVYAGGDAVTGAATVILAMGAGKAGAKGIDEYLKNKYCKWYLTDFDVCGMITSVDNHEKLRRCLQGFIFRQREEAIGWKLPQVQIFPEFPTGAAFLNDSIY